MFLLLACLEPSLTEDSGEASFVTPLALDTAQREAEPADDEVADLVARAEAPFAPSPDSGEGLVNTSHSLERLLESGALEGACEAWRQDRGDRRKELLCGKEMFFYETFGTEGVPAPLVDFVLTGFADHVGPGFERFGMHQDPFSAKGYPLGMSDQGHGAAFTCASCHFGQLPDGRYSVGAPNHDYDYGKHNLTLAVTVLAATSGMTGAQVHPDAQAVVQPLLDEMAWDLGLQFQLMGVLFQLLGMEQPAFSSANQGRYAAWRSGTMDFLIEPLPVDDRVHTVSKISALWDIPTPAEEDDAGMRDAMLGWTGNTPSTLDFVALFGVVGGHGEAWTDEDLAPLAHYLESLTAPEPPAQDPAAVQEGARVFASSGCLECHSGPAGSGLDLYSYDDIGTDPAMAAWMDADLDGVADQFQEVMPITNALKSPRLVGLWSMGRFLHNGSLDSLEQLLCLEERPAEAEPYSASGHWYGCGLSEPDRRDLIAFLESH